jgi:hypothetical protein
LSCIKKHRRMARGGHGLPKVSPRPAMLYSSMPCSQATPETNLWPFQTWRARRVGGQRPSSTPLDNPRRTCMNELYKKARLKMAEGTRRQQKNSDASGEAVVKGAGSIGVWRGVFIRGRRWLQGSHLVGRLRVKQL